MGIGVVFLLVFVAMGMRAEVALTPAEAERALAKWFTVSCAQQTAANDKLTLAVACRPKNDPEGAPLLIGAATLAEEDVKHQLAVQRNAAAEHVKSRSAMNNTLDHYLQAQEVSPKGRLGFYGAHPGFNESALSFLLIDAGTRQSLQLMFSYRPPDGAQKIDEKATAKSMSAIFDTLKKAAFSLEKKYWR